METQPPASLLNARDKRGCTAFALAAAAGVEMSVDLLIAGGADTTVCDKRKRNALMLAASNGQAVVVDALLRLEGFVIDAKDSQHQTALLLACQQGRRARTQPRTQPRTCACAQRQQPRGTRCHQGPL